MGRRSSGAPSYLLPLWESGVRKSARPIKCLAFPSPCEVPYRGCWCAWRAGRYQALLVRRLALVLRLREDYPASARKCHKWTCYHGTCAIFPRLTSNRFAMIRSRKAQHSNSRRTCRLTMARARTLGIEALASQTMLVIHLQERLSLSRTHLVARSFLESTKPKTNRAGQNLPIRCLAFTIWNAPFAKRCKTQSTHRSPCWNRQVSRLTTTETE